MPPKEPTRAQLSSRLAYSAQTPAFLLKLQRKVGGHQDDEDEPQYEDDEFEDDGSGRPPIPRRPAIPTRPDDDPGSADEDDGDEAPQIVVVREGKHLSGREVENEKRKAKGLPPLPEHDPKDAPGSGDDDGSANPKASSKPQKQQSLSFSSGGSKSAGNKKRKAVGDGESNEQDSGKKKKGSSTKKPKKAEKKLLSFDEDA
ncbi:hypothetical protein EIP91_004599 [Steccherinum ochraceum]|uniref:DUF4604 domain-containing protein n=1 Tax=Steccherinum ochraceum TaxID=92696 RepID=A0A4R0R8H2_9APHY|nr:hypothetical protein EIP91_004599 [Steccherinum ochraceum]